MIKTKKIALVLSCLAILALTGMPASAQNAAKPAGDGTIALQHYSVNLSYDASTGLAQIKSMTLVSGAAKAGVQPTGGWRYDVVSGQGEIINHRFIEVPVDCQVANAADPKSKAICTEKSQFDLSLEIPFNASAKNINFYDPNGKMVAFADLSDFSGMCGDGVCQGQENYKTCPQDCRSGIKDGYCDGVVDGVCDPDCSAAQDQDCAKLPTSKSTTTTKNPSAFPIVMLVIIIVVIVAVAVTMFVKKRKGQASDNGGSTEAQSQPGDQQNKQ